MKKINIFCFGFGQVAKNFIKKLNSEKFSINLSVTTREESKVKKFNEIKYNNFMFKDEIFDKNLIKNLKNSDHILVSIPPINGQDIVIKYFKEVIKECNPKWVTYLSATSVYGNHNGEWVDELSKTYPTSFSGKNRLVSEKSWLEFSNRQKIPLQIFRLAGIYSNESNILLRLLSGDANIIDKENHFFSRIHIEDIVNILFKSLSNFKSGEIFNISDDKPSSSKETTLYGVKILNIDKPQTIEIEDIKSEMLKNFYSDSKKVKNSKMKNFFNYNLKFPSYIEGLDYIRDNLV